MMLIQALRQYRTVPLGGEHATTTPHAHLTPCIWCRVQDVAVAMRQIELSRDVTALIPEVFSPLIFLIDFY